MARSIPNHPMCADCGKPAHNPQRWESRELVRFRQVGYFFGEHYGDHNKPKGVFKDKKLWLCGVCYASRLVESEQWSTCLEDEEMNIEDVKQILRECVQNERAASPSTTNSPETGSDAQPAPTLPQSPTFFNHVSLKHVEALESTVTCGCRPYVDIFTVPRWNQQGYRVIRGSKALRVGKYNLFCKHQVEPMREAVNA